MSDYTQFLNFSTRKNPTEVLPFLFSETPPTTYDVLDQTCASPAAGHSVHWIHTRQLERAIPVEARIRRVDGRYITLEHPYGEQTLWNHNAEWLWAIADIAKGDKDATVQFWPKYRTLRLNYKDRSVTLNLSDQAALYCAAAPVSSKEFDVDFELTLDFPCAWSSWTPSEGGEAFKARPERKKERSKAWSQQFRQEGKNKAKKEKNPKEVDKN